MEKLVRNGKREVRDVLNANVCIRISFIPSVKKQYASCPVPVNAHLRPDTHFGSIPEKLSSEMDLFIEQNHRNILGSPGYRPIVAINALLYLRACSSQL